MPIADGMEGQHCDECGQDFEVDLPQALVQDCHAGKLLLFVGAGASTESHNVMPHTFYDAIADELGHVENDVAFPDLMQQYVIRFSRSDLALEDEYIVDLLRMENRDLVPETIAAAAVRYEYWRPIFEHGRARGELRSDLSDEDLVRWLSTVQLHFLSQRALYPGIDDIERDVRLFVVPSITNPSMSRLG